MLPISPIFTCSRLPPTTMISRTSSRGRGTASRPHLFACCVEDSIFCKARKLGRRHSLFDLGASPFLINDMYLPAVLSSLAVLPQGLPSDKAPGTGSDPIRRHNAHARAIDTTSVPRPLFGEVSYGVDIRHCTQHGKIALTFDDGPSAYTSALLDILGAYGAHATFFVVGDTGGQGALNDATTPWPALLKRMVAEGHQIGSHTWSHADISALTAPQRREQMLATEAALADVLGYFPTYMRPPYTRWNQAGLDDLRAFGYHIVGR